MPMHGKHKMPNGKMMKDSDMDAMYKAEHQVVKSAKKKKKVKKPVLGTGERFKQLESKLAGKKGIYNPAGVAASIMWKKYGKKGGARLIKMGKK